MEKIELNLEKLAVAVSHEIKISGKPDDPLTQIIEDCKGKILKIFVLDDGTNVAICEGK